MTLFTISICFSRKKGFMRLFTFTIKTLTYTNVPVGLAHFTHSASIVRNRKTQRSLVGGRGTSVLIAKASSEDSDEAVQTHFFFTDPSLLPYCKHCSS